MELPDSDLVERVRGGDVESYAALVERYYRPCLRFGVRMLGDRADAEEAVQDTFVRAYRSLHRYDERHRFRAWLFRILANRCRTRLARRAREARVVPLSADRGDALVEPDEPVEEGRWSAEVQRALMSLTPPLREALLLRCVEEQSFEEIAAAAGITVSAAKMRVKRARDQLRTMLEELYHA